MADVFIRTEGLAGRITLTRPDALNALSYAMCIDIDAALKHWHDDPAVALVLIDAEGTRAFCAGGDLAEMYATGRAGNFAYGQRFWADEYRMNARIAEYPKPAISFMQGFTMGGGVGLGCHASHRIVGHTAQLAMPECSIGLVPDVGGSALLAKAPGRLGEYLGTTGARMGPGDAILAGFADHFLPEADWPALKSALVQCGDARTVLVAARPAPPAPLALLRDRIDRLFGEPTLTDIAGALKADGGGFATDTLKALNRASPLAAAALVEMLHRLRPAPALRVALRQEYRFTFRALEQSDFLEGIRAAIIDKDRAPRWQHQSLAAVTAAQVDQMLAPLGPNELQFTEDRR